MVDLDPQGYLPTINVQGLLLVSGNRMSVWVALRLPSLRRKNTKRKNHSMGFSGTPKDMGPAYGKRDPYYSHIFRDSYGNGMGIVVGPAYHKQVPCPWGSLESPLNHEISQNYTPRVKPTLVIAGCLMILRATDMSSYTLEIQYRYQKWWIGKCISFQIWLFGVSMLHFRGV